MLYLTIQPFKGCKSVQ